MVLERRNDRHLTSTGVGHDYRAQVVFPIPHTQFPLTVYEPLPVKLQQSSDVTAYDELMSIYETTTGSTHNRKNLHGVLGQTSHPRAPAHWKVHYNKDLREKLEARAWKISEKPNSEMRSEYQGRPAKSSYSTIHSGPLPFPLDNHMNQGPSQSVVASSENKELTGEPYYIRDGGTLNLTDIYASTAMRDFREYTPKELQGYPKKDILTFWQAQDYHKAKGHGLKENPLPKEAQPTLRRPPPMRDTLQFPTATDLARKPPRARIVPNRGLKSLVQDSYQWPLDVKRTHDVSSPIDCPWTIPITGPLPDIMAVPKMYKTEYETYGSNKQVLL